MKYAIETERLYLVSCDAEIFQAILTGDQAIKQLLQVTCAAPWTEIGIHPFKYALGQISAHPDELNWWTYLPVLKKENILIGTGGYHGKPAEEGIVEIGYEITAAFRNHGLATEFALALTQHAFSKKEVLAVQAHTLAEENASVRVIKKCGMKFIGECDDSEVGKLWKWEIRK
jgi:[ribosomal protein S5]-alanine N-acetyltransferase